jgi:hypothetical protein
MTNRTVKMSERLNDSDMGCDLCGAEIAKGRLNGPNNDVNLCRNCQYRLGDASNNMRTSIERFLIGNVI